MTYLILLVAMMGQQGTDRIDVYYVPGHMLLGIYEGGRVETHFGQVPLELAQIPVPAHPDRKGAATHVHAQAYDSFSFDVAGESAQTITKPVSPKEAPQIIKIDVPATCTILTDSTQDQSEIHLRIQCDKGNESRK